MTVADYLRHWKTAHTQAKAARQQRDLAGNAFSLADAQQALLDAAALDPELTDPAWATLPCTLSELQHFYTSQLDVQKVLAPRFLKPVEQEQAAIAQMKAQQDDARAKAHL